jgi:hypothetical protein
VVNNMTKRDPKQAPAGERRRDDERDSHGPVYRGGDWSQADDEHGRDALDQPGEQEVANDVERADEEIEDPGTRGAVFGKGGKGIVERDLDDEPTARKG